MSLEEGELEHLRSRIGRDPTPTEVSVVAAEWSEHCSYKSSRAHLRELPSGGPLVVGGRGCDSGVLDVGGGYVVTVHIESHNHPSAVEPYGGAATGVGGVVRDILSAGTRPIAILNGLRFGEVGRDPRAGWLFRGAVAGIADYGNCLGIPTVGGEVEFDGCYAGYAMVDVASVGFGRRDKLIRNRADEGDAVVLLGGPTGRDGVGGSQFASGALGGEGGDGDRSAVQIPDPFMEKLVIEAVLEARDRGLVKALKDLGGGGLACAVSETADALGVGVEVDADAVHTREGGMTPAEVMTSESQERMLVITDGPGAEGLRGVCGRYRVPASVIGRVTGDGAVRVTSGGRVVADLRAGVVANAPQLDRPSARPAYLEGIEGARPAGDPAPDPSDALGILLRSPNIASREWVYSQYDHEVGIRTVVRPGGDASVLRLDNGRSLAVSMDGNPKHCYINPRHGAMGCFEEACRNVACAGARPVGMVDHLQFGDPGDPGVFWTFLESVRGIAGLARGLGIPCVGGKVSLYNEAAGGPIKPTPVIGVLGLVDGPPPVPQEVGEGDALFVVGETRGEMGGSEYYEHVRRFVGGRCPRVDPARSGANMEAVLRLAGEGVLRAAHDCSKGGLAVAASEMCIAGRTGCSVGLAGLPGGEGIPADELMFSETHSRYLLAVRGGGGDAARVRGVLSGAGVPHAEIGRFGGDRILVHGGAGAGSAPGRPGEAPPGARTVAELSIDKARGGWSGSLEELVLRA